MRRRWLILACVAAAAPAGSCSPRAPQAGARRGPGNAPSYPPAARGADLDERHGIAAPDPYRWLEDPDAPATRAWIEAQKRLTFGHLDGIPERARLRARLTELWNYERHGVPQAEGGRYFFTRNDGLQNQAVVYVQEGLEATPRVLLDPNALAADGTVALSGGEPSPDGKLFAYGTSTAGSDWQEWRVRDVETGRDLEDHLRWVKFSRAAWTRDAKGFYYSRYDEPRAGGQLQDSNYFQKLYHHRLGTPQAEDRLVHHDPAEKEWAFDAEVTEDGAYLVIAVRRGTDPRRRILIQDLTLAGAPVAALIDAYEAAYELIGSEGSTLWLRTDRSAPRGRVVAIDAAAAGRAGSPVLREVVPEASETLLDASVAGDYLIASYLRDARAAVKLFRLDGTLVREVELPGIGSVAGFPGGRADTETFYSFVGFTSPISIWRLDLRSLESSPFRLPTLRFRPGEYVTEQVFCSSRDGTRVPLFLTRRRDLPAGPRPTLLFGYGGFNIAITPSFSPLALAWLELGGIYAVANLRGGGEYGEAWHQAGARLEKQNVFDDFIAAAEWLIGQGHTTSRQLAIHGRSNGGLLVGACMTQRPGLFGAALPAVGVLDMLRFHKFTIGWAWTADYGSPDDPGDRKALLAYSPLHNLRAGTRYPATLVTTADHDDRVVPAHSFKFAAALQAAQAGPAPVLIRIETRAGHGAGKPTSKLIEEAADQLAFLVEALGMESRE